MNTIWKYVQVFFWISAIVFVFALIWAGFTISDMSDECQQRGGVLVKTNVSGYICIDKGAIK